MSEEDDAEDYAAIAAETEPWLYRLPKVSHYYGDFVRQAFVAAAALMLLAAPFYADDLHSELPFEIIGAVFLVAAAAMTNPWNRTVILADAIIAGVGLVIFELWALGEYDAITTTQFILRQAIAVLFMIAFYFSMKTVRAMTLHQVGKSDTAMDVHASEHRHEPAAQQEAEEATAQRKKWHHQAMHERHEYDG